MPPHSLYPSRGNVAACTLLLALSAAAVSPAAPIISEFMASNGGVLYDEDGESSDWLELFNPDLAALSLDGYFLSDDPGDPEKWRLPALSLPPGGRLVVFASNKDRDAGELHTNFRLPKNAGGYLALVDPDGQTVISEFANYPEQFDGISYGYAQGGGGNVSNQVLVREGDACKVLVPTADIGTGWIGSGFDDGAWSDGTTGVGYERSAGMEYTNLIGPGGDVEAETYNGNGSTYFRVPFGVESLDGLVSLTFRMKYDDGYIAYLNGIEIASANKPASPAWNSTATADHPDTQAVVFEDTDLSAQAGSLLRAGDNWLAVHAMNGGITSSDFLALPRLEAGFLSTGGTLGTIGYFQAPTPGLTNNTAQGLPAGPVAVSTPGRGFSGSLNVTLSTASPAAEIRYTTDGNLPVATSLLYSGGNIAITSSTLLRARAFESGLTPGPVAEEGYIRLSANALSFSSDIPVVIMERFSGGPSVSNGKTFTFFAIFEPDPGTGRTTLNRPYALGTRGGWKVRGSSSAGFEKKAFSIEAWNALNRNKDIAPLGMPEESDWILNARSVFDRSLMRNTFIYALSNQVGRYAVRTKFVELFKDDDGGDLNYANDYQGVYTFMEKITRDQDRVDVERLPDSIAEEPGISGGYMLKVDRLDPGDSGLNAGGQSLGWVYPKEEDATPEQSAWIRSYLNTMNASLSGDDYEKYIDVVSWVDHHLLNVLALNADALRLSTYFHKKRNSLVEFGPIWDFDRSMGSTDGRDANPSTWQGGTNYFSFPWWGSLFDDENFWQAYIDRYFELRDGAFATSNIHGIIDGMAAELSEAQVRNFQKWTDQPRFGGYQGEVNHLKNWLGTRLAWMDGQFSPRPSAGLADGIYPAGTTLTLNATLGGNRRIYYTLDGTDPRPPATRTTFVGTELVGENNAARAFVPGGNISTTWRSDPNFNDATWLAGNNGIGYERGSGYAPYININVNTEMAVNNSCYVRMKFNVQAADLATWNALVLQIRYDDGFVAYLNGTQIATDRAPGVVAWNSTASQLHDDAAAVIFQDFDVSAFYNLLQPGENLLAIHALNESTSSSDFLNQTKLVAGFNDNPGGGSITAFEYTGPITLNATARVVARVFDSDGGHTTNSGQTPVGTGWSAPLRAEYLIQEVPASAANLAITEIMAAPYDLGDALTGDGEFEWIELQNTGATAISLTDVRFAEGIQFTFSGRSLAPGERVIVVKNPIALRQVYGTGRDALIAGTFSDALASSGEMLTLLDASGAAIQSFAYPDANSGGRSLVASGGTWASSRSILGSPGTPEPTPAEIPDILVNEVLSNSVAPGLDAVELHNPGPASVDLSGWFLTDDLGQPEKFRIPDGSVVAGGGYLSFTETGFNATPGVGTSFALGSFGEEMFLVSALPDGTRTDYVHGFDFGDASAGVSFGSHTISTGAIDYPPLVATSFGSANASPVAGPLVISELMYHPLDGDAEFVEIANVSAAPVPLAGVEVSGTGWVFGAFAPVLAPGGIVLVTDSDPATFRSAHAVPAAVGVFGPYPGKLDNGGENLRLRMPETTGIAGEPDLKVAVDIADYDDAAPWPLEADGAGFSLQRSFPAAYGSEPLNWTRSSVAGGSPGTQDTGPSDWRAAYFTPAELLDPSISGLLADADFDWVNNLLEYQLGSDLRDASDFNLPEIELFDKAGESHARLIYRIRNGVTGFTLAAEMSGDLADWGSASGILGIVSTTDNGDGTSTVIAETTQPIDTETYLRLRVVEN